MDVILWFTIRNPVDIWAAASIIGGEEAYQTAMEAILEDKRIDVVVPILLMTKDSGIKGVEFFESLRDREVEKPIYASFTGDKEIFEQTKTILETRHQIPVFASFEEALETLAIAYRCHKAMNRSID